MVKESQEHGVSGGVGDVSMVEMRGELLIARCMGSWELVEST